jgi:hypothetical protein
MAGEVTIGDYARSPGERDKLADVSDRSLHVKYGDSTAVDAFGRLRVASPFNLFDNKNIHDRHKNQWEEPIVGAIIEHGAVTGGPFQVAETVTGGTSGTVGIVTVVNGGSITVTYTVNHDDFEVGEEITGGTSGATADITTVGTGSTITFDRNNAAVILQVGASSGDSAVRTSHRYIPYVPGKSQLITQTFILGDAVANVRRRVGYFDPENGLFLEQTLAGARFVRRTKTSGSVVDNLIEQANWNVDTFDGNGPSGIDINFTCNQFLFIDFQWQGSGRIRLGFSINGRDFVAHAINTSNKLDAVWMSTPSLPVRYEISNTGATAGTNTMKEFCTSVVSEGGENLTGIGFTVSRDISARAVTTKVPVLAVRLKNDFNGDNRRTVQYSNAGVFATSNACHFEVAHVHDPTGITATWTSVSGGSGVEYSIDITTIVGNPQHTVEEGYTAAGQAGKGAGENVIPGDKLDQHRLLTQNIDSTNSELFIVYATAITGTSNVYAHISWVEFD